MSLCVFVLWKACEAVHAHVRFLCNYKTLFLFRGELSSTQKSALFCFFIQEWLNLWTPPVHFWTYNPLSIQSETMRPCGAVPVSATFSNTSNTVELHDESGSMFPSLLKHSYLLPCSHSSYPPTSACLFNKNFMCLPPLSPLCLVRFYGIMQAPINPPGTNASALSVASSGQTHFLTWCLVCGKRKKR